MTMSLETRNHLIPGVLAALEPVKGLPLIFDSPHSGTAFPAGFSCAASAWHLTTNVDAHVEELFGGVVDHGATLLHALFPRTFIDPNRSELEIDPALLSGPWPGNMKETQKTRAGMGLIRRYIVPGVKMYDALLGVEEVQSRIDDFYLPYHRLLRDFVDRAHAAHGAVWHVNCHSMKSVGTAMNVDSGRPRPDFVISDRNGTTADTAFTNRVAALFRERGYNAQVNDPYQGAEIIERLGDPANSRNSIQIEINRALYLDEDTYEKSSGFEELRRDIDGVTRHIANDIVR